MVRLRIAVNNLVGELYNIAHRVQAAAPPQMSVDLVPLVQVAAPPQMYVDSVPPVQVPVVSQQIHIDTNTSSLIICINILLVFIILDKNGLLDNDEQT